MGLEFESRAFLHVCPPDNFQPKVATQWVVTGKYRNFFHYCQHLKWSSYDAAREIFERGKSLPHSTGFFSLQEDYLDMCDRSRAYVLDRGHFREIEVGKIEPGPGMPLGLLQHFEWCRHCYYGSYLDRQFPQPSETLQEFLEGGEPINMAGWFYDHKMDGQFDSLLDLFPDRQIAAVTQTSGSHEPYLFVGEEQILPRDSILPVLKASERAVEGRGLLFAFEPGLIQQIAISRGDGRLLAPMQLEKLPYWDDVRFSTGRVGYDPR